MTERKKYDSRTPKDYRPVENLEGGGRLQPQARELEEAVLGALMLEKNAFSVVENILKPKSFYDGANGKIFAAIQSLANENMPIDMLTVVERLRNKKELEDVGGSSYIAQLTNKVVSSAHLEYHSRIVAQKSLARELISFSSNISNRAFSETEDVDELMQNAEAELFELSKENVKRDYSLITPVVTEAINLIRVRKDIGGLSGLTSGFKDLDEKTAGWQNSDLIIVAARPAMGKTAFVLSMAKNMAVDNNIPVAIFSLEMSNLQLANRLISIVTQIKGENIKKGNLTHEEWERLDKSIEPLNNAPIFIDDTPSLSIFELKTKARRLVNEKHKVKCIIIDYLQLMNASGMGLGSREQEVSTISRSLKGLAKELNIPVIALAQLNRGVEARAGGAEGKRPQLYDLRESGAIEQDADIVCFIHRPEYYKILEDKEGNDLTGQAEIIIAKHRSGETGVVKLRFEKELARFQDFDAGKCFQDYPSRLNDVFPF